jgi:hypothetical protein
MLIAYFDDSGSHTDSDVVIWNGLFGNHYQWRLFNELWEAKLKDPSPGKEPLKRFHMFECQNSLGEFSGWSRTGAARMLSLLIPLSSPLPKNFFLSRFTQITS